MNVKNLSEEFVRTNAPNAAAFSNASKISKSGGFVSLKKTEDETLIFGECKGSGKNPYITSADFSGDNPVFRCSCPSRQFPCKHSLALMLDFISGKEFAVSDIPDDIKEKREKAAKKAEREKNPAEKKPPKQNRSAAEKKLKKQYEGLVLAEDFVRDILSRGVSSVNKNNSAQYKNLAKQMGDYYLPEPQFIMNEIIAAAEKLSENSDDSELARLTRLTVKLHSAVKKSKAYIEEKLKSGEVLPEDSILYESMGGIWKLSQLKEIGLYKENARIVPLSFTVIHDDIHKSDIDVAYFYDMDSGDISKTENIRPLKAAKYIKAEDSVFGLHKIKELFFYPGGLNRRIRWESADIEELSDDIYSDMISMAENSISEAVKKAKNELKNTLSDKFTALLLPFDSVGITEDNRLILKCGGETIALRSNEKYPDTCNALSLCGKYLSGKGALLGEFSYDFDDRKIYLCPISVITENGITRLC